ncbi:MAG: Nre family DNA repair protein [Candidatus Diapherotrites archaeon]|nr:Nre family DNA repair protein [Candidatus Diapherotrites archaeon]MDZ4256158.1 Nre family DNA repair protein [archaeon]
MQPLKPSPETCVKCRGRLWCGPICWVLEKHEGQQRTISRMKGKVFSGSSPPSLFVSHHGYPKVKIAPMAPTFSLDADAADLLDNPERWFGRPLDELVGFRSQLIRSNLPMSIHAARNPSNELQKIQEIAMASQKVEVEVELTKSPMSKLEFSHDTPPMGPQAPMKHFSLQENPHIPDKVEYLVSDHQVKAATAMQELYEKDIPVHHLYKLLSAGTLGVMANRKLTPTRWSITVSDDTIGKYLIDQIKDFSQIDEFRLFESHFLDNHFYVLLLPREWGFDIMEAYRPGSFWAQEMTNVHMSCDHEFFDGRKNYAENVAGGYYATRLAVLEWMKENRRQAAAIIFREIGPGYQQPMGVWQCRQNVRNAMEQSSYLFDSLEPALQALGSKLTIPLKEWKKNSKLLDRIMHQRRLLDFF